MLGSRREMIRSVTAAAPNAGQEVLRFLDEQGLRPTPENYDFAWQAKVEGRRLVAMAVDAIVMEGREVLPADVARIMSATARPSKEMDEASSRQETALRHQTLKLADLAAGAATSSSTFGRDLARELDGAGSGEPSIRRLVEVMIGRTEAVEAELRSATREIESLREQMEAVSDDAHRDALTGLLNRRGVMRELTGRSRKRAGAIAICDVDHFKSVNDRFGHAVGDRVLKGVAASLAESCRSHQVARWGGEEFVVLMDGLDVDEAARLMDEARLGLAGRTFRLRETDEPLGCVTASIGVACLRGRSVDEALEEADRRLYAAKRGGRDRVVVGEVSAC